jgi:hypothetical protein
MQFTIPATPIPTSYGNPVYSTLIILKEKLATPIARTDRIKIMICASILYGFNTRYMIHKGIRVSGLSENLVNDALSQRTGTITGLHLWNCNKEGQYKLMDRVLIHDLAPEGMVIVDIDPPLIGRPKSKAN